MIRSKYDKRPSAGLFIDSEGNVHQVPQYDQLSSAMLNYGIKEIKTDGATNTIYIYKKDIHQLKGGIIKC